MESVTKNTSPLNEVQLMLLKLFRHPMSDKHIVDIRKILLDYYDKMIFEEVEKVVKEKGITQKDYQDFLETT